MIGRTHKSRFLNKEDSSMCEELTDESLEETFHGEMAEHPIKN